MRKTSVRVVSSPLDRRTSFPGKRIASAAQQQGSFPVLSNAVTAAAGHIRRLLLPDGEHCAVWTSAGEHLVWREARCALPQDARRGCPLGVRGSAG